MKNILNELKNTTWPKRMDLINLVIYTIITSGIISLIILGVDIFLLKLREIILK